MECNIVKDLLPLYIDGCCSNESIEAVEGHLKECDICRKYYESMQTPLDVSQYVSPDLQGINKISIWKASISQTVLFAIYFVIMTAGVALEAYTDSGSSNGFWAFTLIIPATGFLLSLINWYFVRLYKNNCTFRNVTMLCDVILTSCGIIWWVIHYNIRIDSFTQGMYMFLDQYLIGICFIVINVILSVTLSGVYVHMIGME